MVTYTIGIGIVGAILLAIGILAVKKKDTRKLLGWIGAGGIAVALLVAIFPAITGTIPFLGQEIPLGGDGDGTLAVGDIDATRPVAGVCPVDGFIQVDGECVCLNVEDTTVTSTAINVATGLATGGRHLYKLDNQPALSVSDAGTFSASPGQSIQYLWNNQSIFTDTNFYSDVSTVIIPCKGTIGFSRELYRNGTITIQVFNEENLITGVTGTNETLGSGDVVTLTAKIKGTYQRGMPWGGVMVVDYNKTAYDDVIVDFGGSETTVPSMHDSGLVRSTQAYTIPAVLGNAVLDGTVLIDVANFDPANYDGFIINMTLYPNEYFINEDTGASFDGPAPEDEDDVTTTRVTFTFPIGVA